MVGVEIEAGGQSYQPRYLSAGPIGWGGPWPLWCHWYCSQQSLPKLP
jgi:hypothetical protein